MNSEKTNLERAQQAVKPLNYDERLKFASWFLSWHHERSLAPAAPASKPPTTQLDEYLEHARTNMFPAMKDSAFVLSIASNDPDPKMCLEIGAAICFNKPILVVVPRGCSVPLSLRTIAHKIVEIDDMKDQRSQQALLAAIKEMHDTLQFRSGHR